MHSWGRFSYSSLLIIFAFAATSLAKNCGVITPQEAANTTRTNVSLVVCTLVHNENVYLPEWIEFHRLQGVDVFALYDDKSKSPQLFLDSYIRDGIVDLVRVDNFTACAKRDRSQSHQFVGCQIQSFNDCIDRYRHRARWIAVFDVDEFIFSPDSSRSLVQVLDSHRDVITFKFLGAVFGNNGFQDPPIPSNSSGDVSLVTSLYTKRQSFENISERLRPYFWAHKEIVSAGHAVASGVHNFQVSGSGAVIEFDITDPSAAARMHHYQYKSIFNSRVKASLNNNKFVDFDKERNDLYNSVEDRSATPFTPAITRNLVARSAQARSVTIVLTSSNRPDLLERTLRSFMAFNTYPISRGVIVEDSGLQGNIDFAHGIVDFPVEIVYNPDLGIFRHHPKGQLGLIESVDVAYARVQTEFIFHMEDDWEFYDSGFIEMSICVLDSDPSIVNVWLRAHADTNGHPFDARDEGGYHIMSNQYGDWHGFTFNPGLRRTHDYLILNNTFVNATKPHLQQVPGEIDVNILYHKLGYVAAILDQKGGFVKHIGWGRTTDPGCSHGCSLNVTGAH